MKLLMSNQLNNKLIAHSAVICLISIISIFTQKIFFPKSKPIHTNISQNNLQTNNIQIDIQVYPQLNITRLMHRIILSIVINSEMYQLSQRVNQKFAEPLLVGDHDIIVQNNNRSCTDILCLILFILLTGAFIGLLSYGLISGTPKKVFYVYNSNETQCYTTDTQYGYFPTEGSISNAVCVEQCPTSVNQTLKCLTDDVKCFNGTIISTYATSNIDLFCLPTTNINSVDIFQQFNSNVFNAWATDLRLGWLVLVGAAVAAMILSLIFLIMMRFCGRCIIWVSITVCILGMALIGILFILQAKGIVLNSYISENLSKLSYDSLIIIGSGFCGGSALLALIVICLRTRINMGSKSIQLGSKFIFENCCSILLPISQAIFVSGTIGAIIVGGVHLYSLGTLSFPQDIAFPIITLTPQVIVVIVIYLVGGFWLVFFFLGCNSFIICSAASIWYFNNQSPFDQGKPFGDSLSRMIRYHPGSIAITALVNCVFFALKMICNLLSFESDQSDNGCSSICLKCLSYIFFIFKCFLRILNDGTYVQIAVAGTNYCSSTLDAYQIFAQNVTKIAITNSLCIFFKFLGIMGIGISVTVGAYFACQYIETLAKLLTNPLVITIASGLIGFVVSGIYLSMIDLSAQSIIQCFLIDKKNSKNGVPKYARQEFKEIMLEE